MFLTKDEIIEIFGSLRNCGLELGKTRQAIYQAVNDGVSSEHLTDTILGFLMRNGRKAEIPSRFITDGYDG